MKTIKNKLLLGILILILLDLSNSLKNSMRRNVSKKIIN